MILVQDARAGLRDARAGFWEELMLAVACFFRHFERFCGEMSKVEKRTSETFGLARDTLIPESSLCRVRGLAGLAGWMGMLALPCAGAGWTCWPAGWVGSGWVLG